MPVPKKRVSRTRRDKRRTHKKLVPVNLTECPQCSEYMMPHRICPSCGYYKERSIIETE
ncbi:MAG: 50S ribosomal protein L32 [Desulfomonilaceae bacterium]|uniref:Large ribosomal subunit protein bL32 n=1 Tax=Desulfomonile tiedjei TaxID=2358 RepID=A0A7C4ESB6_9BACT